MCNEKDQAEAVVDGLSDLEFRCECGQEFVRHAKLPKHCTLGNNRAWCACGNRWKQYKKKGWTITKRTITRWRAYEKELLARIADLEGEVAWLRERMDAIS